MPDTASPQHTSLQAQPVPGQSVPAQVPRARNPLQATKKKKGRKGNYQIKETTKPVPTSPHPRRLWRGPIGSQTSCAHSAYRVAGTRLIASFLSQPAAAPRARLHVGRRGANKPPAHTNMLTHPSEERKLQPCCCQPRCPPTPCLSWWRHFTKNKK